MEWTSLAITEVFVSALALSAFGMAAVLVPIYLLGVVYRGLRSLRRRQRNPHLTTGFGKGPIIPGRRMPGTT